jgi:hypothetical protein
MYTIVGRLLFLIMVGIMVFALDTIFAYTLGVIVLLDAIYNVVIMAVYHKWTNKVQASFQSFA